MQTNIAVHDTDQKQGSTVINNPNCGPSRKEKKISTPGKSTQTTSMAMLVTRDLALAARLALTAGLLAGAIGIACRGEAAEVAVWKSQHKPGPTAPRTGIEDCTVTAPTGAYEVVCLEFDVPTK